jgi:hypothetical protein
MALNYEGSFKLSRLHWQTQLISEEPPAYELFDSLVAIATCVYERERHSGHRNVGIRVARNECLVEMCLCVSENPFCLMRLSLPFAS